MTPGYIKWWLMAIGLYIALTCSVVHADRESRKAIEIGIGSYLVVLDKVRLTERGGQAYTVTQEDEPPSFVNQQVGIYLERHDLTAEKARTVAENIDRTIISIRILDATSNDLMFEYQGPLFRRDLKEEKDHGLINGAWSTLQDRGIRYLRTLDGSDQYRLDRYYKLLTVETPFRRRTPHRIEFSVLEPMVKDPHFDGAVMLVIRGGTGK